MIFEKFTWFWKFFIFTISSYDVYFATYSRLNVHVVSSGKKIQQFWNNPQMKFVRLVYIFFTLTFFVIYLNCAASTASPLSHREKVTRGLARTSQQSFDFVHLIISAILSQTLSQTNLPSHSRAKKFLQFSLLRQQDKNLMRFSRQALIPPSTRATLKSFGDVFAKSCNQCRCK